MCNKMAISAYILKIAQNDPFLRLQMRVSEELWLFNHKRADFWLPNFGFKRSLLSLLNRANNWSHWITISMDFW